MDSLYVACRCITSPYVVDIEVESFPAAAALRAGGLRKYHVYPESARRSVFRASASTMHADNAFGDGQTQARSA